MAIDATVPVYPPFVLQYGNPVTVQPADPTKRIEVWRAPDNGSGAPNDGASVACTVLPPSALGGTTFVDPLPNDGAPRYYKCRHLDEVGNASTFTPYSDGLIPQLITGSALVPPMAAYGAIVDNITAPRYELQFSPTYLDPDVVDGMQSYIDFPAATNFMRIGQTPKAIGSSTNATPIQVTSTAHGYVTGDVVTIRGHLVNTNANGTWTVTVVDANNYKLQGSVGNGVGGATGHSVRLSLTVDSGGNLTSYGALQTRVLKVVDSNNATIFDIESGKRVIAIPIEASVDSGSSVVLDLSTGLTKQVRLTASAPTIQLTNPTDGSRYRLWLQQDTTGSRAFPVIINSDGFEQVMYSNDTKPTLTTTPGAFDIFELEFRQNPGARYTCMPLQTNVLLPTPSVNSVTASNLAAASTTFNVNVPAVTVGDLLLVIMDINTSTANTPAGWTAIGSVGHGGSTGGLYLFGQVVLSSSGSGTVAFTFPGATVAAAQTYRITRWSGVLSNVKMAATTGGSASVSADPPNLSPGFTDRDVWIAACGSQGAPIISAYPTNYGTGQTQTLSGGGNSQVASARRVLYATTEDPSTFTLSSAQFWAAMTICVNNPF